MASELELIEPALPTPYRVAFSTRRGGVSEGPFASLNLGLMTGDAPERVLENRRRLCAAAGADPGFATMARQRHGARVVPASATGLAAGTPFAACDGLWSSVPGLAMALVTADCLPVALWRRRGPAALCVLHAGWRGLLAGVLAEGVRALGPGSLAGAIGPGIGPCCYEVGEEVATPFRAAFGAAVAPGNRLDLPLAAERALAAAGCERIERLGSCTACDPGRFFSHRRDEGRTGRQGIIGYVVG